MALVRCNDHNPHRRITKNTYSRDPIEPLGYPNMCAVVCGNKDCLQHGLIWLTTEEMQEYTAGERIFTIPNGATKLRAK